jgi:hypothetical protein
MGEAARTFPDYEESTRASTSRQDRIDLPRNETFWTGRKFAFNSGAAIGHHR